MKYTMKSHPTMYKGVQFRSRLEARWACFLDLVEWRWEYEPLDLPGWTPDFCVEFPCGHSECPNTHTLLAEVKPYSSIKEFEGHPCMRYDFGGDSPNRIPADASAAFGINPFVTYFVISHGAGGGVFDVPFFANGNIEELWNQAGNLVQWMP